MKGLEKSLGFEPSHLQDCFTHIFLQQILGCCILVKERPLGRVVRGLMNQHDFFHVLGLGVGAALFLTSRPIRPWA